MMQPFKMGRKCPPNPPKRYMRHFLTSTPLPAPPTTVDWSPAAMASIGSIYLNDQLGDCVIAAMAHAIGTWSGNTGGLVTISDSQVRTQYQTCGGGDQGCDEQSELGVWAKGDFSGIPGSKILGFVGVDARNQQLVQQCVWLFGGLFIGFSMPNSWLSPMPQASGFTWDTAGSPNPGNGHAVWIVGYNSAGVKICTWAMTGTLTWAALARYCVTSAGGELYAILSPEWEAMAKSQAPNAIDWAALETYFNQEGGNVPVSPSPTPTPPPVPTPIPTPPVPGPPPAPTTDDVIVFAGGERFAMIRATKTILYPTGWKAVEE